MISLQQTMMGQMMEAFQVHVRSMETLAGTDENSSPRCTIL